MAAKEQFTYQPGVCNIDSTGVRWRKNLGIICLVAGTISMIILYYIHFGMIFRFFIGAGFGYTASLNLFQAKEHFCVANASKGTFEVSLQRIKIADDFYKNLDRQKMKKMIVKSLLFALLGGCFGLLPL